MPWIIINGKDCDELIWSLCGSRLWKNCDEIICSLLLFSRREYNVLSTLLLKEYDVIRVDTKFRDTKFRTKNSFRISRNFQFISRNFAKFCEIKMENVSEISRNQKSAKFRELSYREISYPPYTEFYHIHDSLMLDDPISYVSRSPVLFFNGDFCR